MLKDIKIWDRFVRIFHWSLVILFITAYFTRESSELIHQGAGYTMIVLVIMRLIWGFVGGKHALFKNFIYSPQITFLFLFDTIRFKAKRYLGHNPAGGAMVVALLSMISLITISGIMMTLDMFWGQKWLEEIHETATHVTLLLIFLHICGVLAASLEHKENLIKAMFTGKKKANKDEEEA
jgi:cytochrome b